MSNYTRHRLIVDCVSEYNIDYLYKSEPPSDSEASGENLIALKCSCPELCVAKKEEKKTTRPLFRDWVRERAVHSCSLQPRGSAT